LIPVNIFQTMEYDTGGHIGFQVLQKRINHLLLQLIGGGEAQQSLL